MKYDPIISEQMKHLPTGCLTALTEDILRQTHPHLPTHWPADYYGIWAAESGQDSAQREMNSK